MTCHHCGESFKPDPRKAVVDCPFCKRPVTNTAHPRWDSQRTAKVMTGAEADQMMKEYLYKGGSK